MRDTLCRALGTPVTFGRSAAERADVSCTVDDAATSRPNGPGDVGAVP